MVFDPAKQLQDMAANKGGKRVPPRPDGAKAGFKLARRSTGRGRVLPLSETVAKKGPAQ
jgi:hypothetical protein